ncbi:hypothetical protein BC834DRAFT_457802 [Gloeopeniophorella convolvens]|nr:hypothetical protein BC834DRAFT_457802 [Gloeopeniophorella convolvens]
MPTKSTKGPSFLQGEGFTALVTQKHKREAFNHVILEQLHLLDPVIGDASCEQRVPFVIDVHAKVIGILKQEGMLERARGLVLACIEAHKNDKADTQVRTKKDANGAEHDPEYDQMVDTLVTALGPNKTAYLTLCHTFTISSVMSKDEFQFPFSPRSRSTMTVSVEKTEETGSQEDLQFEVPFRSRLASLAIKYLSNKTASVPRTNPDELVPGDTPTRRTFVEDQLIEANHHMRSAVEAEIATDFSIPLLTIYNQLRAMGLQSFNDKRSVLLRVRRMELTPLPQSSAAEPRFTHAYTGSIILTFKPNHTTGHYEVATDITPEEKKQPCLLFDAWSTFVVGTNGRGLDAEKNEEYRAALVASDFWWLIMQYAATHPVYTGCAVDKDPDYSELYDAVCEKQDRSFAASREDCEGFNLKKHVGGDVRPNLVNEWSMAARIGISRGLADNCQPVRMAGGGTWVRINRAVDFQIDHIYCDTLERVEAETQKLEDMHSAAPNAIIGPVLLRIGERGVSCTDKPAADEINKIRNKNKKRAAYVAKYPGNEALVLK